MLVGEPPQTRLTSGQSVPKWRRFAPFVCGPELTHRAFYFGTIFPKVGKAGGADKMELLPRQVDAEKCGKYFAKIAQDRELYYPCENCVRNPLKTGRFFGLIVNTSALFYKQTKTENADDPPPVGTTFAWRPLWCLWISRIDRFRFFFHHFFIRTV